MEDGAEIAPRPATCRCPHDDFAAKFSDVEPRTLGIVYGHAMHGHLAAHAEGPLIGVFEADLVVNRSATGEAARDFDGAVAGQRRELLTGVGEDGLRRARRGHPIDRTAVKGGDGEAGRFVGDRAGFDPDGRELDRREPGQAVGRGQLRHARVHHHHAGGEPDHEQDAQRDAEPAMAVDERPCRSMVAHLISRRAEPSVAIGVACITTGAGVV